MDSGRHEMMEGRRRGPVEGKENALKPSAGIEVGWRQGGVEAK